MRRDGEPGRRPGSRGSSCRSSSRARTSLSSTRSRRSRIATDAQLRLTRLRPSGRGADVWDELHPTAAQQRELYEWLLAHGESVLTGDSFFHLGGYGASLPGLNLCGAGRVVCLIDPIGDVYACPFAIHDEFLAGNVRGPRRVRPRVARVGAVHLAARAPARRRVRELRAVRHVPRRVHGREVLHRAAARRTRPRVRARPRRTRAGRARRRAAPEAVGRHVEEARPGAGVQREPAGRSDEASGSSPWPWPSAEPSGACRSRCTRR